MAKLIDQVKAAHFCSTPLLRITTTDAAALTGKLVEALNGKVPAYGWDVVRGVRALNHAASLKAWVGAGDESSAPMAMLMAAEHDMPEKAVLIAHNLHRHLDNSVTIQAVWNLRDVFKTNNRMLVLLGPPFDLPTELADDFISLDDPLPTPEEITELVNEVVKSASELDKKFTCDPATKTRAIAALRGLPAFKGEQVAYMSVRPTGFDLEELWEQKRIAVNAVHGLTMNRPTVTFKDIGGLDELKAMFSRRFAGPLPPSMFVRIDEFEKTGMSSAAQHDTSGTSQDQGNVFLQTMQDEGMDGVVLVGPPGCSKSMISYAVGAEFQVPTLSLDLGACLGGIVGQSQERIRTAMRTIKATGGEGVFVVATCNKLDVVSPELKRRFTAGIYYCGLPSSVEKAAIWTISLAKYKLDANQPRPDDTRWTGSDIERCCRQAYAQSLSLVDAAGTFVPVYRTDPQAIDRLEELADGRFLSVSRPGPYRKIQTDEPLIPAGTKRSFNK